MWPSQRLLREEFVKTANEVKSFKALEAEAQGVARQAAGQLTPGLYVPGVLAKVTKERAVAMELEANPELYERLRQEHNGRELVRRLESAGVALVRR